MKEKPRVPPGQSRIAKLIPAPGGLEAVQAFLNTAQPGTDELATPRQLSNLLSRQGLLPAGTKLTPSDLERAREARRGLRVLTAANSGGEVDGATVARLDQAAAGARAQVRFETDGTPRLEPVSRNFDDALGTLLGYVYEAHCRDTWRSFKLCANGECRKAFFDFTKGRTGKWCTRRCGEKVRARAFRQTAKYKNRVRRAPWMR